MTRSAQVAPMTGLVMGLAAVGWYLMPERALAWGACVLIMVAGSLFAARSESQPRFIGLSVVLAGLLLAVSMVLAELRVLGVGEASASRQLQGLLMSVVLMVIGNAVPKVLRVGQTAAMQRQQRLTGWVFALTGLVSSVVWPLCLSWPCRSDLDGAVCERGAARRRSLGRRSVGLHSGVSCLVCIARDGSGAPFSSRASP